MTEFSFPLQIYYEDTDLNGFVYFTNYLKYMERATTHLLGSYAIKMSDLVAMNVLIAVRTVQCTYLRPAHLDDKIEVISKMLSSTQVTMSWEHTVRSQEDKNKVFCRAAIERLCINRQLQPIAIPAQLMKVLQEFQ